MRLPNASLNTELIARLQQLAGRQAGLQNQVSTGQRITQPGDDPFAAGQVVAAQLEQSELGQAGRNANAALFASQNTAAALGQLKTLSGRAGEIAMLASGTLGGESLGSYAVELNQLLEQAVAVGNSAVDGGHLFAGTATSTAPFAVTRDSAGKITAVAYVGGSAATTVPVGGGVSLPTSTNGATNAALAAFMGQISALRDGLAAGDTAAIQSSVAPLDSADDAIVNTIGDQAAIQSRIEAVQAQQQARLTALGQQITEASAADLPSTIVKLTQANQAYEAALSSAAKLMNTSLLDYLR